MEDIVAIIGSNLKRIRSESNLSIERTSALTGISKSMISEIEKGVKSPTVALLWKLCNGLNISLADLTYQPIPDILVTRAEEIEGFYVDEGVKNKQLFTFRTGDGLQVYEHIMDPGKRTENAKHGPNTEEMAIIIEGMYTIHVGAEEFVLKKGDTIQFSGDNLHHYRNEGTIPAKAIIIIRHKA